MAGRPSKFNSEIKEKMIALYADGKTDSQVSEIIGVSLRTVNNWKAHKPEFLHTIKRAKRIADQRVEASLYQRAIGYSVATEKIFIHRGKCLRVQSVMHLPPDVKAQILWLRNRDPERWK